MQTVGPEKNSFTDIEAAAYVGISVATLRRGRIEGQREGHCPTPPFIRIGRLIRYLKKDLDQWLDQHRVVARGA